MTFDVPVVDAPRQMEKCNECRKGNVKQKVGQPLDGQIACTPRFDSVGASVHQLAVFGLIDGVTGALKKIYPVGQMLGAAEGPGVLILTRSKTWRLRERLQTY
jgi:hypothetical protein